MRKPKVLIILAVSLVVILVVCLTVAAVFSSLAERRMSRAFDDSDLIPVRIEVAVESNAFWTLVKATNELYWPDTLSSRLDDLSNNTNWDESVAAEALEKNRHCLDLFDEAMRQPFLLVPEPKSFEEEYSYLSGWKAVSRVESIRLFAAFRENNENEAFDSAFKIIEFGQRAENSGGQILHYLVGAAIKSIGLRRIQQILPQSALPETNLVGLINKLDHFKANQEGLTNSIKAEYQIECKTLDELAAGKIPTADSDSNQMSFSPGVKLLFNPTKTKIEFARADRVLRDNLSRGFSEIPWSEMPVVKTNATIWQRMISGNAIGDILYQMLVPSLKPFASRVSHENVDVTATQILVALKIYKMRHGKLPTSLSELVPEFFPEVPMDNFDGKPFRYRPDKKLIYSVGPDLRDSDGDGRRNYSEDYDLPFAIEF
jgi:hypothetical protein